MPYWRHGETWRGGITKEYAAYQAARYRCTNPRHRLYPSYGGRGIEVRCRFADLLAALGRCPPGMSLDRIDPNGHYEIGNLRWATAQQQRLNRRGVRYFTLDGEHISLRAMAQHLAADRNWFRRQIRRAHVSVRA